MKRLVSINQQIKQIPEMLQQIHNQICILKINRPAKLNTLNTQLIEKLAQTLDQLQQNPHIKVVILTGHPAYFCLGLDLNQLKNLTSDSFILKNFHQKNYSSFVNFKKPLIAAVNGPAFGAGTQMALLCDIIFASQDAVFCLPEQNIGTIPGRGGTQVLPRVIGKFKSMDIILQAKKVSAQEAFVAGFVSKVCEDPLKEALQTAQKMQKYPVFSLVVAKAAVCYSLASGLKAGLEFEKVGIGMLWGIPAIREYFFEEKKKLFQKQS